MLEFRIRLRSVRDVQDFVDVASTRPFDITIRDDHNKISAQSFMELFCLDFTKPLRVVCDCSQEELHWLRNDLNRFLVQE